MAKFKKKYNQSDHTYKVNPPIKTHNSNKSQNKPHQMILRWAIRNNRTSLDKNLSKRDKRKGFRYIIATVKRFKIRSN